MGSRVNKILVVLLSAVIILGIIIFWRYTVTKDSLLARERRLVELNEKIAKLTEERSGLSVQIHKNAELLKKLRIENKSISQLRETIKSKDHTLSEMEKDLRRIETDLKAEKENTETFRKELSSKDAKVIELQDRLKHLSSVTKSLKEEIVRGHGDLDRLQDKLLALQGQEAPASTKEGRSKSSYDAIISELTEQMQNKAAAIAQLLARLESIDSKTPSLTDEGAKGRMTPDLPQRQPLPPAEQKAAEVTEPREQLKDTQSKGPAVKDEIVEGERTLERRQPQPSAPRGQEVVPGTEVDQLRSTYEAIISDLNEQMQEKAAELAYLQKNLHGTQTEVISLKEAIGRGQTKLAEFQRQVSRLHGAKAEAEMRLGKLQSTYDAMISELKEQIRNQEVMIKGYEERLSLSLVDRILFDFGKATLTQEGRRILTKVGKALRSVEGRRIVVIGHTDNVPIHPKNRSKFPSNWELSAARSAAVVRFLQARSGLDPKSMEAVGRSLYDPIASNNTPKGRAQNRRVEIVIAPEIGME